VFKIKIQNYYDKITIYKEIIGMVRELGMEPIVTLFHHSTPVWAKAMGGWVSESLADQFVNFTRQAVLEFGSLVKYWITLNEPSVYSFLSYSAGVWPDRILGPNRDPLSIVCPRGSYCVANRSMADAHNRAYKLIHEIYSANDWSKPQVGIAHNMTRHIPSSIVERVQAVYLFRLWNWYLPDLIAGNLDFLGLNYYGVEHMDGLGIKMRDDREYSESGRAVSPYHFYTLLKAYHKRYNIEKLNRDNRAELPFIVTENGISDGSDLIRPAYIVEHLKAMKAAMDEGVPVKGYIFWTVSDNWEWADGYCPKFGLVAVDRTPDDLVREKRGSYDLFSAIATDRVVTVAQADRAWQLLESHIGKDRPFCRSADGYYALDAPVARKLVDFDWRFSKSSPID